MNKRIILVYPQMGISGAYVCHMPLGLLYAAIESIKAGLSIDIVDTRLFPSTWRQELANRITPDTLLLGVSVMTGTPVGSALEISRWVRDKFPGIPVVWGGAHAICNAREILSEKCIDYVISSYGSLPLANLARSLRGDREALPLKAIAGLTFRTRETGQVETVPPLDSFEIVDYREIPYFLIEEHMHRYGQFDNGERVFSMYSTMGCPYHCGFCSSPAIYRQMAKKYEMISPMEVADHIELVYHRYQASYIYFIDDDSFVDLGHVESIIDEISRRGLNIKLGFRGARINEIMRMDEAYLIKLTRAGTDILHIGAESGSQRMLDLMRKNITVADILEVNKKLAGHPEITAGFNWIIGFPGETIEDLRATRELIMQLVNDNPNAFIFPPNKYRPHPGTELYEIACNAGYKTPEKLEEWVDVEVEGDYRFPWYSRDFANMVNMMQVTSYFLDNKLVKLKGENTLNNFLIRLIWRLYKPLAKLRFRYGISSFLIEYRLYNLFVNRFRR